MRFPTRRRLAVDPIESLPNADWTLADDLEARPLPRPARADAAGAALRQRQASNHAGRSIRL
jgi:hypothetical protein